MNTFEANCKICEDSYTDETGTRKPKILTGCGHTICELCALKIMSDSKIVCPFDRIVTKVPEGNIDFLRKNFSVLELIDEAKWKEKVGKFTSEKTKTESDEYSDDLALGIPCDENKSHLAVLYCLKCETHLCKWCSIVVHSSSSISNHTQVPLTEKPEPLVYCSSHPHNVAELICKQKGCIGDNRLICSLCHLYGTHKGHAHELIENEYDVLRAELHKSMSRLDEEISYCKEYTDSIKKSISTFSDKAELVINRRNKIERFSEDLRNLAINYEYDAEKTLNTLIDEQTDVLETTLQRYENSMMEVSGVLKLYPRIKPLSDALKILNAARNELENVYNLKKSFAVRSYDSTLALIEKSKLHFVVGSGNIIDFSCFEFHLPEMPKLADFSFSISTPVQSSLNQVPRSILKTRKMIQLYIKDDSQYPRKKWFSEELKKVSNFFSTNTAGDSFFAHGDNRILILKSKPNKFTIDREFPICLIVFFQYSVIPQHDVDELKRRMSLNYFNKILAISRDTISGYPPGVPLRDVIKSDERASEYTWSSNNSLKVEDILNHFFK